MNFEISALTKEVNENRIILFLKYLRTEIETNTFLHSIHILTAYATETEMCKYRIKPSPA